MAAQSTAEASKKEACFHVESQRIAEGHDTLPADLLVSPTQ
jgi:hypothetical protein